MAGQVAGDNIFKSLLIDHGIQVSVGYVLATLSGFY
jgi:hypothetical protein